MKTSFNKISAKDVSGTSYKGYAVRTTANLLIEALGIKPNVWLSDLCEWYLEHGDIKFTLYAVSSTGVKGDEVLWFRIGTFTKIESIDVVDMVIHCLKTA